MKKILIVFGTRPEAIKMAPLVKNFQLYSEKIEIIICVTGQHREMLDQVLKLFSIQPNYDLDIMKVGQDLYDVTSRILLGLRDVLRETNPNLVLVHGDTSTSTAAALAAFYQQIPVGHIEAGLRTNNIYSPWPEEMNRQITSRIATYHFAPTQLSKENLLKEGINEKKIIVTGNTVIDALYWVTEKFKSDKKLHSEIVRNLIKSGLPEDLVHSFNSEIKTQKSKLILITGHRRENFGEGFINICKAIKTLTERYPDFNFVYPMHLNPNVRKPIKEIFRENGVQNSKLGTRNIFFIEPLDYLPFVFLMNESYLILTDSGGIQEEAPSLGKPVLVMRDTTERPEALEAGTVKLVGTNYELIVTEATKLIEDSSYYNLLTKIANPYGDGKSSVKIVEFLLNELL